MTLPINIEVQARTDQAVRNLKNLTDGAGDIKQKFNDDAAGALGVFGVSLTKLDQPLTLVAETLKQSIEAAANWGDSMGDLAQMTGASVQDTSKLAATFELVGVSTGTLESAIKSMTKNGLALNIETMKSLAKQYQAIQDPVEKNAFLFKNFGRAGAEMAEIMGRSTAELDKLSNAALRSGKVIGEDAAGAAEEFNTNMAILQQKVEGAQIAIGNALIPVLNDAATSFDQLTQIWQYAGIELAKNVGFIDQTTASAAEMKAFGIEPATEAVSILTVSISEATAANKDMADSHDLVTSAAERQSAAHDADTIAAAALKGGLGDLTAAALFNQAAAGLDSEAALALGVSMGVVDQKAADAAGKLAELRIKYDSNKDGAIDAKEAAAGYAAEVIALGKAVDALQDKVVTVRVNVDGDVGLLKTSDANGNRQIFRAAGGPVEAGQPYIVGEKGPEWFVPAQSGQILPNSTVMNVGGISINGAGNPSATAAAVRAELDRLGRSTDNRIRTR